MPNLSETGQSAAEVLMINDRFFVRFRGCFNTGMGDLETREPICTNFGGEIVRTSPHPDFKNGEDILLGFQTTAVQSQALLSDKAKIALFDPL